MHAILGAGCRRGRGRVFPQHVTFATPNWRATSSGRHTRISTLWQPRPPRQWRQSTTAAATTVSRRTLRERGQRRSFHKYSVRPATPALYPFTESSLFPYHPSHNRGPTINTPPRPANPQTGTKCASPLAPQSPRLSSCSCTVVHESNATAERSDGERKKYSHFQQLPGKTRLVIFPQ